METERWERLSRFSVRPHAGFEFSEILGEIQLETKEIYIWL